MNNYKTSIINDYIILETLYNKWLIYGSDPITSNNELIKIIENNLDSIKSNMIINGLEINEQFKFEDLDILSKTYTDNFYILININNIKLLLIPYDLITF